VATTETEPTAPSPQEPLIGDPHWIFEALLDEHDYVIDEVDGKLPAGLRGTLYRNGPGKWEAGGQPLGHIFDGDGMLSMFAIDDGRVRYRNRYVRTNHYLGARESRGAPERGFGTLKPGGILANALRLPANVANTSVVLHAGELLALWEGGNPYALDPDTLDTLGPQNFDGGLRWLGAFSAHPKVDPLTGDLFNFGIEVFPRPMLRCYRLDPRGRLHHLRDVHIPEPVFNHDVALTERHMVFVLDPITMDLFGLPAVALGLRSFDNALRFRASKGTTIVLVPRDGSKPRVLQTEALMHFHVNNAYEDATDTVVDLVVWDVDWNELNSNLRDFRTTDGLGYGGHLTRLRITQDGQIQREQLSQAAGEFPQHDWRLTGRPHRYSYLAVRTGDSIAPNAIVKTDHQTTADRSHELAASHAVSEPIFVPRTADAAEDDGWLLAVAYDPAEHRSRLLVLDARDPGRAPLFIGYLSHHVPQSFHGTFTRRVARPDHC
jgi:all-trans-8'-apo-beta-carotenal 15,15'-oxygenase